MKSTPMRMFLAGALIFSPLLLRAQTDPSAMPSNPGGPIGSSSSNSSTPGVHSGLPSNGVDSSMNGAGGADGQLLRDKIFVRKAALGGLAEVQLGQLAAQKATSEDVKKYGQRMVDDHTILNDALKPVAQSMGVALPSKLSKMDQQEYDKLNGLSGTDFDKEYLAYMTEDHKKDLHEFQIEAAVTNDPALKDAVTNAQAVIGRHLRWVFKLDSANGVPTTIASK